MPTPPPPPSWFDTIVALSGLTVAVAAAVLGYLAFRRDTPNPVPELLLLRELPGIEESGGLIYAPSIPRRQWLLHPWRSWARRAALRREFDTTEGEIFASFRVTNRGRRPSGIGRGYIIFDSEDPLLLPTLFNRRLAEGETQAARLPTEVFAGRKAEGIVAVRYIDTSRTVHESRVPKATSRRISEWLADEG